MGFLTIGMMRDGARTIIRKALEEQQPDYVVSMVSGGKDSAASHMVAQELGVKFDLILHGNTRTGIPETTEFVTQHYGKLGPDFAIADAGSIYEDYVLKRGFFGVGREAHNVVYRRIKADPFRSAISRLLRKRRRNIKVLLLTGARRTESSNRAKRMQSVSRDPKEPNNVWVAPLLDWPTELRDEYLCERKVPINPVAKALCRSGECMCGTMQSKAERAEAAVLFPRWGKWLRELEQEVVRRHGFGWGEHYPKPPAQQNGGWGDDFQPMCVGCNARAEQE